MHLHKFKVKDTFAELCWDGTESKIVMLVHDKTKRGVSPVDKNSDDVGRTVPGSDFVLESTTGRE